jgi:prepilin-type N-terminal cleavage/methylation domain-containing protein
MDRKGTGRRGFTLIEILTGLGLLGLLSLVLLRLFLGQTEAFKIQNGSLQTQQTLRSALEILHRDFRGIGYPPLPSYFLNDLSSWFPASYIPKFPRPVELTGAVSVASDPYGADTVTLLLVLPGSDNPTVLSQAVSAGDTRLPLALSPGRVSSQYRVSDVLYIGQGDETAVVVGISGSTLMVDTDPGRPGWQGLKRGYPARSEVGELSLVSYALFTDLNDPDGNYHEPGIPLWKRKVNAGGFEPLMEGVRAVKVESLPPSWYRLRLAVSPPPFAKRAEVNLSLETRVWKK